MVILCAFRYGARQCSCRKSRESSPPPAAPEPLWTVAVDRVSHCVYYPRGFPHAPGRCEPNPMTPTLQSPCLDTADEGSVARRCTVTLVVPTLNEITGMKAIMPRVRREW